MTDHQNSRWTNPRFVAVFAILALVNLIADWFWFKPENIVLFLLVEAAAIGGIVLLVNRRQPPSDGGASSGDMANFVP